MQIPFKPTALAIALACLVPAGLAFAAEPQAAPAAAETTVTTPGGRATFLLPQGWASRVQGNAVIVTPPEADGSRSAFVDTTATDVDAAVAEAWKVLGLDPKFLLATDAAPRDGWDQRRFYDYDIPANAKRVVNASAFRKGKAWTVVVADVDQAIAEKRGSQYGKIAQRFQPAGYTRETFAGRTAHKLDAARLQQVSDFVEQMRKDFEVPGVAIGIVQDGKVVLSRGFGVRELGKPDTGGPATPAS
jgi:hypothetical protein